MLRRCCLCMVLVLAWANGMSTPAQCSLNLRDSAARELKRAKAQWPAFITAIRAAVRKRDHTVLKSMMASDFRYQNNYRDERIDGDSRDTALHYLKTEQMMAVLATQLNYLQSYYRDKNVHRVAGKSAGEAACPAVFEFRNKWYFTGFFCVGGE